MIFTEDIRAQRPSNTARFRVRVVQSMGLQRVGHDWVTKFCRVLGVFFGLLCVCVCVCARTCAKKKNLPSQHILKYIKYHIDIYSHMCGRALELIHLASLKPYICWTIPLSPLPLTPSSHPFILCFSDFDYFRYLVCKCNHVVFVFLRLAYFT